MQQFTVPQFIDVEDKIIGPLTTRQFLILLTGFFLIGICYKLFDFSLFLASGFLIFALSGIFAFLRINGRPFHYFVLNFVQTLKRPGLRVWSKAGLAVIGPQPADKTETRFSPKSAARTFTGSRLSELSLIVDTRGAYKGEIMDNE